MPDSRAPGYGATLAVLSLGQIISWAILYYAFTAFVLPMRAALGWSEPVLMGAFTLGLATSGAFSYASGAAIDRGHGRLVMSAGAVLGGLGCLAWSQVTAPWMLHAAWVVLGAAMAMSLYEPAFNVLTHRYPLRFGHGITVLTLVGGLASTLCFPVVTALQAVLGWRGALVVLGLVLLGVVAPLLHWALKGTEPRLQRTGPVAEVAGSTVREALGSSAFWLVTTTFTLYSYAAAALWAHAMPALAAKGFTQPEAMSILVWVGPAQVAGRLLFAWAGRGMSARTLGLVVLGGLPASFAWFTVARGVLPMMGFALLFGFANGLVTIVRGNVVPEYFGRSHVGRIGGLMSAVALFARAAAPLATAWGLVLVGGYGRMMWVLAGLGVAALLAFAAARPPRPRPASTASPVDGALP